MSGRKRKEREKSEKDETHKGEKQGDKQTKLDSMVTQINKESSMPDLIYAMNLLHNKINLLASKECIDKSLQRLASESFVKQKLNELREQITTEIKQEIKTEMEKVYEQIGQMNTMIADQTTEIGHLKSVTSDLEVQIETNKSENETLKALNKDLKDTIKQREVKMNYHGKELNILEQFTRRNSLRIYGMHDQNKFETTEQTSELVCSMFKNKLDVTVQMGDIDISHRLGTFRPDGNRPIICKFVSREIKLRVLRARRLLKGSSAVVREDLTRKKRKTPRGARPET